VANLINAGILPLTFANPDDYDKLTQGDELELVGLNEAIVCGEATLINKTTGESIQLCGSFSERQQAMLKAGGLLKYTRDAGNN
jgi:aconitate hydratase